ncbi:hypothetical protein GCM10009844_16970 [Nocardioides koreensis]|uniref:WD40 repeat domain-containing protein n=1 Tax=Nocardioides koreensis TaxID=433651 RepID=A0ABP5LD34_9ACTN
MNASLRDLNDRADALVPPSFDIDGIVERGDARLRRRRAAVAAGAACLVAAAVVAGAALTGANQQSGQPARNPTPTPKLAEAPAHRLTYADDYRERWSPGPHWLIQSIQYGDQRIRLDVDAMHMDVTDDGVVLVDEHGGVHLADGSTVERIGETAQQDLPWASGRVDSGNAGSLVSWFTPAEPTASLVVYDTSERRVVAEQEIPRCSSGCPQMGIVGDRVYVDDPVDETAASGPQNRVLAFDVSRGDVTATDTRAFWDDLRDQPRALVKSNDPRSGEVVAIDAWLATRGDRLALQWLVSETGPDVDGDGRGDGRAVFGYGGYDTGGRPVDLRLPEGYTPTDTYRLFQWLDDDRFAVIGAVGDGSLPDVPHGEGYADILVCDLASARCDLVSPGPDRRASYTDGGFRLVPDLDAPN